MNTCPCCSNTMTRNFRQHHIYWFCRSCWQEMPLLEQIEQKSLNTLVKPLAKRPLVLVYVERRAKTKVCNKMS